MGNHKILLNYKDIAIDQFKIIKKKEKIIKSVEIRAVARISLFSVIYYFNSILNGVGFAQKRERAAALSLDLYLA